MKHFTPRKFKCINRGIDPEVMITIDDGNVVANVDKYQIFTGYIDTQDIEIVE